MKLADVTKLWISKWGDPGSREGPERQKGVVFGTRRSIGSQLREDGGNPWGLCYEAMDVNVTCSHQTRTDRHGPNFPRSSRRNQPCRHPDFGPLSFRSISESIAVVKSQPICGHLLGQIQDTDTVMSALMFITLTLRRNGIIPHKSPTTQTQPG